MSFFPSLHHYVLEAVRRHSEHIYNTFGVAIQRSLFAFI